MAKVVYKSYNRNEGSLFPVYLSDMVAAEHPARVVDAVVEGMDKVNVEFGLVALAHNLRKYACVQTLEHPITSEPVEAELPKTHEKVAA